MNRESSITAWEQAYIRFETPEQEQRKFTARLISLGIKKYSLHSRILELCCGRGSGLIALKDLGYFNLTGLDLSKNLLSEAPQEFDYICADCRDIPVSPESFDIVVVQGGLHHLCELPSDLKATIDEISRILVPGGSLFVVEPWDTLFLRMVHTLVQLSLVRRLSPKCDALQVMIENESDTYFNWLSRGPEIEEIIESCFTRDYKTKRFGKLMFRGSKRSKPAVR